ncbi:protein-glucosylgalactosylhydroxylysine glucosidase isoform X1 [Mustela nigripes]|uniref:protein-glucosylgalactosylhydroxylysine glucosidase isoform X1 n=1 Tax=Mustela nigripes TaxID=77151 RepID=UPI0028160EAF|nr:protein-glucosylgalactosylhydroxylysine glucosidase isoform X1 [Mustela nigripes]XP_059253492.1 protein-glucosylgalactosylhydroxylysine glucosidase isoform X1 [Mustela nigripes]
MEDASEDPTIFTARSLPSDPRLLATMTNTYLGTRVYHDTLHVSGVYNGASGDTHRAVLPSPLNVQLEVPGDTGDQLTETFVLDTNTGSFLHTLESPSFRASQRIYAHRTLPHVMAFSVSVSRVAVGDGPVTVLLRSTFSPKSPDLDLHLGPDFQGARYLYGRTLTPEQPGGSQQEVHMLWTPVPPALTLGEREQDRTWEFLTVVGGSQAEAQACLTEALRLQAGGALYPTHAQAWAQLWAGCGLDVLGPLALRQALRGALYYLLSALPQPGVPGYTCHGLSPGGLSNGSREECYWGHVFWDQDLWMFPNILMFHPEAARALLEYRVRTLGGALDNARKLGYQGAKFAWESAGSGLEVCPEDIYGTQEIHINGAVALAFELYYHATQDVQLFREAGGWDVVRAVAEFWCSRVEWSPEEGTYHLKGVMPPDEYHSGVNNSVYTNVLVQNSLRFAAALAQDLGQPVPSKWLVVADKIKVPFDPRQNFHPEFDGYQPGEEVKQADVVLLGYPVPFHLSPHIRRKNLEIYEAVTSPRGPAMTWSMFAVGWMELKDPWRARDLLERCFAHIAEPFKVWTENADGSGAVNFLTGMGGFLQAALFGFTGFRITSAGVTFDPICLAGVSGVCICGLSYQGNKLDFSFSKDCVTVEVKAGAGPWAPPLEAELWPAHTRLPLLTGHKVSFPCSAGRIQRSVPEAASSAPRVS